MKIVISTTPMKPDGQSEWSPEMRLDGLDEDDLHFLLSIISDIRQRLGPELDARIEVIRFVPMYHDISNHHASRFTIIFRLPHLSKAGFETWEVTAYVKHAIDDPNREEWLNHIMPQLKTQLEHRLEACELVSNLTRRLVEILDPKPEPTAT